jgi:hypothetical protein
VQRKSFRREHSVPQIDNHGAFRSRFREGCLSNLYLNLRRNNYHSINVGG